MSPSRLGTPFRLAVRAMRDAAILVDGDDEIVQVSPAFEVLSGFSEADLVGRPRQYLHVSGDGNEGKAHHSLELSGAVWDEIKGRSRRYHRADGGEFWGETTSLPLLGENGHPFGHCLIVRDVSDRVRRAGGLMALIAFVAGQSAYRDHDMPALLDLGCSYFGLEIGVLCSTADDVDRVEAVGGRLDLVTTGQSMVGEDRLSSLIDGEDGMIVVENAGDARRKSHALFQDVGLDTFLACPVSGVDRRHGTLLFAGRPDPRRRIDGRDRKVLHFIAQWVAGREDTKAAWRSYAATNRLLTQSEERYRYLYEKTPAMLHSIDRSGRLTSVSDGWLSNLGYRRNEVMGRWPTDFLTEESKRYAIEEALPSLRATGRCNDVEYQFVTKDGDVRDILLSAIAQSDDEGHFVLGLAVLLDITERKQVEQALNDKTAALERSNADLARFAHIASHDFQEPLRRVITHCQILKEDFGAELSVDAVRTAGIIQSGGRRLRLMINDLLSYVRLNEQLDRAFEPVDMSAILGHALDDLNDEIKAKGARIDVGHLPLVRGRAPLLKMVLYHLIGNAIKFGGERSPTVDVSVEDGGEVWRFAIADRGIGVEPRFADRIFEIFQRLHPRDEGEGSGSGLAICQLIVQRCGGEIWLDHAYENGARFLFTLPKTRPPTAEPNRAAPLALPAEIDPPSA